MTWLSGILNLIPEATLSLSTPVWIPALLLHTESGLEYPAAARKIMRRGAIPLKTEALEFCCDEIQRGKHSSPQLEHEY